MDPNCMYCSDTERRNKMLMPIIELKSSKVYLAKDQSFEGRCVVAYKKHKKELFDLTVDEVSGFMEEVAIVARAVAESFGYDKINYAIFGDKLSHLHVHIAGKKSSDSDFGIPYNQCQRPPVFLLEEEYEDIIQRIKEKLNSN